MSVKVFDRLFEKKSAGSRKEVLGDIMFLRAKLLTVYTLLNLSIILLQDKRNGSVPNGC